MTLAAMLLGAAIAAQGSQAQPPISLLIIGSFGKLSGQEAELLKETDPKSLREKAQRAQVEVVQQKDVFYLFGQGVLPQDSYSLAKDLISLFDIRESKATKSVQELSMAERGLVGAWLRSAPLSDTTRAAMLHDPQLQIGLRSDVTLTVAINGKEVSLPVNLSSLKRNVSYQKLPSRDASPQLPREEPRPPASPSVDESVTVAGTLAQRDERRRETRDQTSLIVRFSKELNDVRAHGFARNYHEIAYRMAQQSQADYKRKVLAALEQANKDYEGDLAKLRDVPTLRACRPSCRK